MSFASLKFDIFSEPVFDNSLASLHEHTYKPYGSPGFNNSDEIRMPINFQDLVLDIADSYIYIEGKFTPADATKKCYLSNNALAFLFDEIRYELGGEQVAVVRKPGITTALKTLVSCKKNQSRNLLTIGWGLSEETQDILDPASHVFNGKLPLKYFLGFAEDYPKGVLNVKHELILIIARNFANSYIGETEATVEITKLEWKVRHIVPDDRQKIKLFSKINKAAQIKIPYRMWDLYELPSLRETPSDIWAIKTSTALQKPRYIIIGFQSIENSDNHKKNVTNFINANVRDIRLYLNSEVYPYERWNLDFSKKIISPIYHAYENFQRSYYNHFTSEPLMSISEFLDNPIFVMDCNHQPEAIKSSTVDVKVEFESKTKFAKNIKVYALILHDAILSYNALDGTVRTGSSA